MSISYSIKTDSLGREYLCYGQSTELFKVGTYVVNPNGFSPMLPGIGYAVALFDQKAENYLIGRLVDVSGTFAETNMPPKVLASGFKVDSYEDLQRILCRRVYNFPTLFSSPDVSANRLRMFYTITATLLPKLAINPSEDQIAFDAVNTMVGLAEAGQELLRSCFFGLSQDTSIPQDERRTAYALGAGYALPTYYISDDLLKKLILAVNRQDVANFKQATAKTAMQVLFPRTVSLEQEMLAGDPEQEYLANLNKDDAVVQETLARWLELNS